MGAMVTTEYVFFFLSYVTNVVGIHFFFLPSQRYFNVGMTVR